MNSTEKKKQESLPVIAITMGDPAGIGHPEHGAAREERGEPAHGRGGRAGHRPARHRPGEDPLRPIPVGKRAANESEDRVAEKEAAEDDTHLGGRQVQILADEGRSN